MYTGGMRMPKLLYKTSCHRFHSFENIFFFFCNSGKARILIVSTWIIAKSGREPFHEGTGVNSVYPLAQGFHCLEEAYGHSISRKKVTVLLKYGIY